MINQSTIDSLKAMKLTAMATELEHQLEDASIYRTLGFEERLGLLVMQNGTSGRQTNLPDISKMPILLHQMQP